MCIHLECLYGKSLTTLKCHMLEFPIKLSRKKLVPENTDSDICLHFPSNLSRYRFLIRRFVLLSTQSFHWWSRGWWGAVGGLILIKDPLWPEPLDIFFSLLRPCESALLCSIASSFMFFFLWFLDCYHLNNHHLQWPAKEGLVSGKQRQILTV